MIVYRKKRCTELLASENFIIKDGKSHACWMLHNPTATKSMIKFYAYSKKNWRKYIRSSSSINDALTNADTLRSVQFLDLKKLEQTLQKSLLVHLSICHLLFYRITALAIIGKFFYLSFNESKSCVRSNDARVSIRCSI